MTEKQASTILQHHRDSTFAKERLGHLESESLRELAAFEKKNGRRPSRGRLACPPVVKVGGQSARRQRSDAVVVDFRRLSHAAGSFFLVLRKQHKVTALLETWLHKWLGLMGKIKKQWPRCVPHMEIGAYRAKIFMQK